MSGKIRDSSDELITIGQQSSKSSLEWKHKYPKLPLKPNQISRTQNHLRNKMRILYSTQVGKVITNCSLDTNLFILVSRHSDERCLGKCESLKIAVGMFVSIVRSYDVNSWLVLVHRVQNCLKERKANKERITKEINRPSTTINKQK